MDLAQVEAEVLAAAKDAGVQVTVRPRTADGCTELDLTTPEAQRGDVPRLGVRKCR